MTDIDDWYDDDFGPAKEEPDCYACGDSGRSGRWSCASCNPNRLQVIWYRITNPARIPLNRWRWRGVKNDGEAPF